MTGDGPITKASLLSMQATVNQRTPLQMLTHNYEEASLEWHLAHANKLTALGVFIGTHPAPYLG